MSTFGEDLIAAAEECVAHARGEIELPTRVYEVPTTFDRWYVVLVTVGRELEFCDALGRHAFSPKLKVRWTNNGKEYERDFGLYSGAAFVNMDMADPYLYEHVANQRYFRRLIPGAPLTKAQIERERDRLDDGGYYVPDIPQTGKPLPTLYRKGTRVKIIKGALIGCEAITTVHATMHNSHALPIDIVSANTHMRLRLPVDWFTEHKEQGAAAHQRDGTVSKAKRTRRGGRRRMRIERPDNSGVLHV